VARLLPLLLALAAFLIVAIVRSGAGRPRSDRTYRPRRNPWPGSFGAAAPAGKGGASGLNWTARRAEVEGVRDAYSSAALDPDAPLYRCGGCLAFYQQSSVRSLAAENGGRCALCGGHDLRPVRVL
jgi:hypothetical protein